MNTAAVDKIARALLYEGYMLYPYRPSSVKNRQRFNFGVLYPRSYSERQEGADSWFAQTECLVAATESSTLEVRVRFLHLQERSIQQLIASGASASLEDSLRSVAQVEVAGRIYSVGEEAVEREVSVPVRSLADLSREPLRWSLAIDATIAIEQISDQSGNLAGLVTRSQKSIRVSVEVSARKALEEVSLVTIRVKNALPHTDVPTRVAALAQSLISTHTILYINGGEFISLLEPPESVSRLVEECRNIGTFPVLVGERDHSDMMLSSPIILYDYPEVAAESAGDLFDATEIDEILSLRIMTLTDEEKNEVRNADERSRLILERIENLPQEQLMKLHGALRSLRPLEGDRER